MKEISPEELERGKLLLKEAFEGPWRYKQFEIECGECRQYRNGDTDVDCTNPECTGEDVPCTFVEAPEAYPRYPESPQIVATIEVPGLSDLAEKNGECICWLRNEAGALILAYEQLLELRSALEFVAEHERHQGWPLTIRNSGDVVAYAKSLGWKGP